MSARQVKDLESSVRGSTSQEITRRRTFAIISHPDAGKTTLTEKLLLFGGAIQMAGTVKGRKAARHATSDWMRLEQQRGISVTSSVMQFPYRDCIVNLLDTPGHEDFSEDTYRTLTAVDSALMVIDCAKGVEERTIKLMEVCRLRDTPIMTFINKLDRDGRAPIELLDEIETRAEDPAPRRSPGRSAWAASCSGIYHLLEDRIYVYEAGERGRVGENRVIDGLQQPRRASCSGEQARALRRGDRAGAGRDASLRPRGLSRRPADAGVLRLGHQQLRRRGAAALPSSTHAPAPLPRAARERTVEPRGAEAHRLRLQDPGQHGSRRTATASRSCACAPARYQRGMRLLHVRLGKEVRIADALTFMAADRAAGRGGLRRRHHRPAQPRHHQHRRHLHRGRAAELHRRAQLRARRSSAARC